MTFQELLDLFRQGKATAKSHIRNLIEMATVDGHYAAEENTLLLSIAARNGVSAAQIEAIRNAPDKYSFAVPQDERQKFHQLYDLVHMMVVDRSIHPEEMRLSELFAIKFGYPKKVAKGMIDTIKMNIENGNNVDQTHERVIYYMKFAQT